VSAWRRGHRFEEGRWHVSIRPAPRLDQGPQSRRNDIDAARLLKDFRRIATRHDKRPKLFSGVCLVAAVAYWI
jgi:hypothetical protein